MQRIIEVGGDEPVALREQAGCVLIERNKADGKKDAVRVPMNEIAVLVIGPRTSISGSVLGSCSAFGTATVVTDARHMPVAMTLPLAGNVLHAERLRTQIEQQAAVAPAVWYQIVRAKLEAQSEACGGNAAIDELRRKVKPGDPENVEGQAARVYWRAMFGADFRRDRAAEGVNSLLNYGYAVLRAIVARAVTAAGLHPAIGLHHRARENAFALADDLMEPARAIVDKSVKRIVASTTQCQLDKTIKRELLGDLMAKVRVGEEMRSLFDAYARSCGSLYQVMLSGGGSVWLFRP